MKLPPEKEIAGFSLTAVRSFLRRRSGDYWRVAVAARILKTTEECATKLVDELRRKGYVEIASEMPAGTWRNTMAGNALAMASRTKQISRREGGERLAEFLARVEAVNADESFPHRVGKVVVFGSYLGDKDPIGDVDLAVRFDRRPRYAANWPETLMAYAEREQQTGRRFGSFLNALAWAETEMKRILRGGVRALSLHDWNAEEPWLSAAPHRILLEEEDPLRPTPPRKRSKRKCSQDTPF